MTDEQFLRIHAAIRQSGYEKANSVVLWPYGECIQMEGVYRKKGYSTLLIKGKRLYAHRIVWSGANDGIPKGMHVLHRCDNPACVNLDHLFLGTQADNNIDRAKKDRGGLHRLEPRDVRAIRKEAATVPNAVLASVYNVHNSTISLIRNGKRRVHIE